MSPGEQMVFAAAFVHSMAERRPFIDYGPTVDAAQQERDAAAGAAEEAATYVRWLRDAVARTREGWGEDSDVYQMTRAMCPSRS